MVTQTSGAAPRGGWRRAVLCGSAGVALVALSSSRWGSVAGADPSTASRPAVTVVVAATDIPAGSVVESSMLSTTSLPLDAAPGLVSDAASLVGRVLAVPVDKGEPLGFGMTAPRQVAAAGHRLVRVSIGSVDVAPDVNVGGEADLIASFAPTSGEPRASVTVVATVRVAALERQADAAMSSPTQDAAPLATRLIGATTAVTLDCTSADALKALWARDNARTLRLLAHPGGDPTPPAVVAPT